MVKCKLPLSHTLVVISSNPELYPKLDSVHRFAVLKRFQYKVIYRLEEGVVFVVALAYASQSPGYWRGRG